MLELLKHVFSPNAYVPHGHCYLWQTPLVGLHILSDGLTAIAYFSIPILLIYFVRQRQDIPFSKVFILFSLFILLCGTGHLIDIWTLWYPVYWISGIEKAMTAIVSGYTALSLVELLPQFLSLKSPEELQRINEELETQITERKRAEALLESRVEERTAALVQANAALEAEIRERTAIQINLQQMAKQEHTMALVLQRMRQSLDLDSIFQATTDELRQAMECDRTLIYRFTPDWSGEVIAESVGPEWRPVLRSSTLKDSSLEHTVDQPACIAKHLEEQELLRDDTYFKETQGGIYQEPNNYRCVSDVSEVGFEPCYLRLLAVLQARAYITVPIFCRNQLWGLLAAYQNNQPRHWLSSEIQVMVRIGNQLGVAVQQAELFTQIQQQAEELKVAKEEADRASRAKGAFLATVSHELRTPLNVILGLTQLLCRNSELPEKHLHQLETIGRSGEHLLSLINDVLEISKIEAGEIPLHEESFSLMHILDTLQSMMQVRAATKGLNLSFSWTPNLPHLITTDRNKLNQILINLLGNAVKFTPSQGNISLRVQKLPIRPSPGSHSTRCQLVFEVEDDGPGIATDEIPHLFKPFFQTQTGLNAMEGTGLGLAISQRYAQLMGGNITVESELGQGSKFTLAIQAGLSDVLPLPLPVTIQGQVKGLASDEPTRRILIVEDHPVNRLLLVKMLSLPGFEIQEVEDGKAAIALWQSWKPDLILMDIQMPGMNGYDATRCIREIEQAMGVTRLTPIIAVTASAFEDQQQEAIASGCNDIVTKPFKSNRIFEKIASYVPVQYLYEAQDLISASSLPNTPTTLRLEPSLLESMPPNWVQALHQAATQGNDLWISELLADIPADRRVLAQTLNYLIQEFEFEQIAAVTKKVLDLSKP
ncbi:MULTISPECIES: response regulator [unclassified Leptolyngbya]|uniref:response regulator n=1 Tax=unclassified Leptolyngbya TaxID=2650499 RepID=UPI001687C4D5|nr:MULTISPECIES: response regulator [unclassified Leptolyngbya]MBD1911878.1 response regulator [Leptolyngbya sp. FACHB-8]MBD2156087.1 response regulator [Leptolyngbya sp. FACHB-16]